MPPALPPTPPPSWVIASPNTSVTTDGRSWSAWLCWGIVAMLVVIAMISSTRRQHRLVNKPNQGPPSVQVQLQGKSMVAQRSMLAKAPSTQRAQALARLYAGGHSTNDKLAIAVVAGEMDGDAAARLKLAGLGKPSGPQAERLVQIVASRYDLGGHATPLSIPDQQLLTDQLGWFGELAAVHGRPDSDPQRAALLARATRTVLLLGLLAIVALLAIGLGFIGLVVVIVFAALGKIRARPGDRSGVRWPRLLHIFAIWVIGWLGLSLLLHWLAPATPLWVTETIVALFTLLTPLWPMFLGDTWAGVRRAIGLHRGAGILTEIACGAAGYLCGLPLLVLAAVLTFFLNKFASVSGQNPIVENLPTRLTLAAAVELYLTAAVLAPLLEELVFRGALLGHLHQRHAAWLSVGFVAVLFAAIHPQGWTVVPVLSVIAITLGTLRVWRDSLIASMTAHAINNAFVVTLLLIAIS